MIGGSDMTQPLYPRMPLYPRISPIHQNFSSDFFCLKIMITHFPNLEIEFSILTNLIWIKYIRQKEIKIKILEMLWNYNIED